MDKSWCLWTWVQQTELTCSSLQHRRILQVLYCLQTLVVVSQQFIWSHCCSKWVISKIPINTHQRIRSCDLTVCIRVLLHHNTHNVIYVFGCVYIYIEMELLKECTHVPPTFGSVSIGSKFSRMNAHHAVLCEMAPCTRARTCMLLRMVENTA